MTTRRALLGLAGLAGASALVGCSADPEIDPALGPPADQGLKDEITFGIWDKAQEPAMLQIIEAFNQHYPDIAVSISTTAFGPYFERLRIQATGDDLPDVFWINGPNFELYASYGMLQDLTDLEGFDTANYPPNMVELYSYQGTPYAIPKDFDTIGLWYNTRLFDEAGVEHPSAEWTWEDFQLAAKTISDELGDQGVFGFAGGVTNQALMYPAIMQAGGEIISEDGTTSGYDSPGTIEAFTFARSLVEEEAHPSIAYLTDNKPSDVFNGGKSAMLWSGNWSAAVFKDSPVKESIRTAPLPQGSETANVIHGIGNAMAAEGKNKAAAAAFLAFVSGEAANIIQAEEGAANPAYEGTATAYVEALPEFDLQMFIDNAADARPYPVSKNTGAWLSLESDYFPRILNGELEVEAGLGELAEKMNQALADEQ